MLGLSQKRLQCAAARACSTCCWPVTFDGLRRPQKGHRWPKEKMRPGGPADGDLECPARFRFPCSGPDGADKSCPPMAKNATLCNASLRAGTIITARISAPARRRAGGKKHNKLSHGIGHAMPLAPHATTTRSLRGNLNGPRRPKCGNVFRSPGPPWPGNAQALITCAADANATLPDAHGRGAPYTRSSFGVLCSGTCIGPLTIPIAPLVGRHSPQLDRGVGGPSGAPVHALKTYGCGQRTSASARE